MGSVAVSNKVIWRSRLGRFAAACEGAATATVQEAIDEGAALSKGFAPKRTGALAGSIESRMTGATSGVWEADTKYAMSQEKGAGPHPLPARVRFFWDKANRMWMWPETYEKVTGWPGADPINHPGNPAHPFLRPAYEIVMAKIMTIARRKYPG